MKLNKITQLLLMTSSVGLVAPIAVLAEDEFVYDNPWSTVQQVEFSNRVEVGLIYTTDDSLRFGQFNGEVDQGVAAKLNVDLRNIDVNNTESADFWNLKISDLGLESRHLAADFGIQGTYKATVSYTEVISRELFLNQASSLYSAGWGTPDLGAQSSELGEVDADLVRKNFKMGAVWDFMPQWQLSANIKQEDKKGEKTRGAYPGPGLIAEAIDAELFEIDFSLSYASSDYQANLKISRSEWNNNYQFQDYNVGGADERLGVEPDNTFEQVKLDLAWQMAENTRFYFYGALGTAKQDDAYLQPTLATDKPLPRTSLDGTVDYSDLKLAINHRFASNVIFNISYKFTDRDNKTAQAVYEYASIDRTFCFDSSRGVPCNDQNTPLSWSSDEFSADITYRINNMWTLAAGAVLEEKERTSHVADITTEDKYWAKVKFRPSSMLNAEVKYTYSEREPNEYEVHHHIRYDGIEDNRVNDEALRQYHKGDRELNRWQATLRYTPSMDWSMGLAFDRKEEAFSQADNFMLDDSSITTDLLGLRSMDTVNYTADISYQPHEHLNITLFVSQSDYDGEQLGGRSDASVTPWQAVFADDANLFGLNLDWEIIKNRLDFEAKISYMDVNQTIDALKNTGDMNEYGDIKTDETTIELGFIYRLNATTEVKLAYEYLSYNNNDWQYFNLSSDTYSFTNEPFDNDGSQSIGVSYVTYF